MKKSSELVVKDLGLDLGEFINAGEVAHGVEFKVMESEQIGPDRITFVQLRTTKDHPETVESVRELTEITDRLKKLLAAGRIDAEVQRVILDLMKATTKKIDSQRKTIETLAQAVPEFSRFVRSTVAKSKAAAKLAKDPTQKAKVQVKELWEDWQSGRTRHKSGAAFARFVLDRVSDVQSEKTIERWSRVWSKEREAARGK